MVEKGWGEGESVFRVYWDAEGAICSLTPSSPSTPGGRITWNPRCGGYCLQILSNKGWKGRGKGCRFFVKGWGGARRGDILIVMFHYSRGEKEWLGGGGGGGGGPQLEELGQVTCARE